MKMPKKNRVKKWRQEDLDGNPNTAKHNHIDDTVELLMRNDEIADKFTKREVKEMVERAWDRKEEDKTLAEFQKDVEEDIEADAEKHAWRKR